MDRTHLEKLSAFMDGEGATGVPGFAEALLADEGAVATWHRYHVIGDCLRREGGMVDDGTLAQSIRQRLAEEPTVLAPPPAREPHKGPALSRWSAMAIAASAAAFVVIVLTRLDYPGDDLASEETGSRAMVESTVAPVADPAENRPDAEVDEPGVASKLNRYLADHSNFASGGSLNGMVPLATFVTYNE